MKTNKTTILLSIFFLLTFKLALAIAPSQIDGHVYDTDSSPIIGATVNAYIDANENGIVDEALYTSTTTLDLSDDANDGYFRIIIQPADFTIGATDIILTVTDQPNKEGILVIQNIQEGTTFNNEINLQVTGIEDTDGDGVADDADNCVDTFNPDQADSDGDGVGDACDNCAQDPDKTEPGICGCGSLDVDSDGDGVLDCNDVCADYNDNIDSDSDGIPDGCDEDTVRGQTTITIYSGWTLFSLPFDPAMIGITDSEGLGQAINAAGTNCDVIMMYDGAAQSWVDDLLGLEDPSFGLYGTDGYLIHCDSAVSFTYEGSVWV